MDFNAGLNELNHEELKIGDTPVNHNERMLEKESA